MVREQRQPKNKEKSMLHAMESPQIKDVKHKNTTSSFYYLFIQSSHAHSLIEPTTLFEIHTLTPIVAGLLLYLLKNINQFGRTMSGCFSVFVFPLLNIRAI